MLAAALPLPLPLPLPPPLPPPLAGGPKACSGVSNFIVTPRECPTFSAHIRSESPSSPSRPAMSPTKKDADGHTLVPPFVCFSIASHMPVLGLKKRVPSCSFLPGLRVAYSACTGTLAV